MKKLKNIIEYILLKYPNSNELSKPRLVKLIYLIDWKHAIDYKTQYTDIRWYFNHYGPYVEDVINLMKSESEIFEVTSYSNPFSGGITDKFKLRKEVNPILNENVIETTKFIIDNTHHLNWSKFISLVYSSYPIKNSEKYTFLNLESFSSEFNDKKNR
ncbi:Panacea domain-containing protein [uncultured Polaribacter sp.]|uniref:Panacea domain-containing protein n=1 Tax=uncultured Polaribacter sp. TaxID=174711 RepID=UPI002602F985|nr:Panacea domain-containing protein [uncultured Polaribacter sp.]